MNFCGWDYSTALQISTTACDLSGWRQMCEPYKSPHYLLNADLYNAARYLSLISILLAANSERMWHLKLFLFPGGGTWKIHIKEAWEQAHWDSITSLNIDISLKLRDSLNNFFLPHFSRYIDKWQKESESWVSAASLLFFWFMYIFSRALT